MKILSITAQKPNSTGSGVYLTELMKVYSAEGYEQALVAGVYRDDEVELPGKTVFYPMYFEQGQLDFPIVGMSDEMPYKSTRYCDMTEEMVDKFKCAFREVVEKAVGEFQPDVILCHHLYLLTASVREWFPEKKVCGFCHNTDLRQMHKTNLEREYIASQIRQLDHIYALHDAQKEMIREVYGVLEDKIQVVGMGYNSNIFFKQESERTGDIIRLVFAGKIAQKKGVISLIRSLSYLPYEPGKLELLLAGGAGNEEEYEEIRALASNCPYNVQFLGKLPQIELANVYNMSDIFVLPSFSEGLPLTVIEALACGDRVVMSDLPGVTQWLDTYAPGADIRYVTLPGMRNMDEALPEELPAFEKRIADALRLSIETKETKPADVSRISWKGIAEQVICELC